jgi:hypothetical protein
MPRHVLEAGQAPGGLFACFSGDQLDIPQLPRQTWWPSRWWRHHQILVEHNHFLLRAAASSHPEFLRRGISLIQPLSKTMRAGDAPPHRTLSRLLFFLLQLRAAHHCKFAANFALRTSCELPTLEQTNSLFFFRESFFSFLFLGYGGQAVVCISLFLSLSLSLSTYIYIHT